LVGGFAAREAKDRPAIEVMVRKYGKRAMRADSTASAHHGKSKPLGGHEPPTFMCMFSCVTHRGVTQRRQGCCEVRAEGVHTKKWLPAITRTTNPTARTAMMLSFMSVMTEYFIRLISSVGEEPIGYQMVCGVTLSRAARVGTGGSC